LQEQNSAQAKAQSKDAFIPNNERILQLRAAEMTEQVQRFQAALSRDPCSGSLHRERDQGRSECLPHQGQPFANFCTLREHGLVAAFVSFC
jgi:hypothetical protein